MKLKKLTLMAAVFLTVCLLTCELRAQSLIHGKWNCDVGLGATLNTGNVNSCNVKNDISVKRNDSVVALEFRYKLLYNSLINKENNMRHWQATEFEVYGGAKMSWHQYSSSSPFLAFEVQTNKFKGYDFKMSSAAGVKFLLYRKPSVCDYSISAAFVYDRTNYTDETHLPVNNYRISFRPKFVQIISENLTLEHRTFFQPSLRTFEDYIVNSQFKFMNKISKRFLIDLTFTYEYRSHVPADTYKKHDFRTEVSVKFKI